MTGLVANMLTVRNVAPEWCACCRLVSCCCTRDHHMVIGAIPTGLVLAGLVANAWQAGASTCTALQFVFACLHLLYDHARSC
jgi:hypothetical protein